MAPTKIARRSAATAPIAANNRRSSSKLPIAGSTGKKSLLRPRSSFGLTKLSKPAKGGIVKPRERKDVSSSARNILQEKGFKLPAPVTAAKKSVRFKESSGIKAPGRKLETTYPSKVVATQRNPFETAQNVGKELKDDKTSSNTVTSQFGENFVFEEDPAALASILNNEGVSASLLQKTQIDEAKKEGKTADEFLLLPDGRPSLCRRIPRNRSSVIQADGSRASLISSRVSAGPVRVARISNVATGRTSFANPKRGSVIRTSTRNSLYNMIDKRYSQHGNENAPPANTSSRASFITTGKGKKPSQSDITTKPTEEELQKSAARRVLRPKIEENLACASPVLRVPAVPNPLTCSPAMRIRSGRKALKKSALTDKQASNSPKIKRLQTLEEEDMIEKDNVAVALFQDEENASPLSSEKATLNPTKKKSLSRLRPVSQIHAKSASQAATSAINPKQGIAHNKDKSKTGIGKIEANERIIQTKFLEPQLSPGEELVQPKVLNASDDSDHKATASSGSHDTHSAAVASLTSLVKPQTINATKPSSLGVSKLQRRSVSKLPTRKSKMKSNVDPNQVLEIMYKKLARIKRRSVRDEFTSVVESVEMSLACSTLVEEEEETENAVRKGKVPEPASAAGADQESPCPDAANKPARTEMRPWREVLAAESTSPTWRDLLSKESNTKLPAPRPAPATAKSVREESPEVDTRRTMSAIPTRTTGQKVAGQVPKTGDRPPAKSDEEAAEVSMQLRLTYEESLRQMQLAEAENRRIEEEMKRLQLEKLSLQERNTTKSYEKPVRSTSASINKMMHMKNRLLDILDSKIDIPSSVAKKQPDTRSLRPPMKYFNPIVSPEVAKPVSREIDVTKAETLPPTKGLEVEEKRSPNMLKPKSANAFSWEKEKAQGKITSGRIGHVTTKVTPDRNAEKCKIETVISPKDETQRTPTALPVHQQKHIDRTHDTPPPANLPSWDPSRSKIPDASIVSAGSSATAGSNYPGGTLLNQQKHIDRTQNTPPPANLPSWDPSRSVLLAGKIPDAPIVSAGSLATVGSNSTDVTQLPKLSTWSSPPQRLNQKRALEPSVVKITDSSQPGPVNRVSQPITHASSGHAEPLKQLQEDSLLKNYDVECRQQGLPGTCKDYETDCAVNPAVTAMAPASNAQAYKPGSVESGDLLDKMHNIVCAAPESLANLHTETKKSSESETRSQLKSVPDSGDLFKDITCETPSWLTAGLDNTYNWLVPLASKPSSRGQKSTLKSSPDTPSLLAAPDRFNSHWVPDGDKPGRDKNGAASKSPLEPSPDTLSWITKPQFACLKQAAAAKSKNDTTSKSTLEPSLDTLLCLAEPQFACMEQTKSAAILEFLSKNSNANHISEGGFSKKARAKVDENCNITESADIKAVTHYEKQTDLSLYHANMSLLTPCGGFNEIPGFSPLSAKPSANLIDISFAEGLTGEAPSQHNPISRTAYSTKPLTPVLTGPKRPDGEKIPVANSLQSKTDGLLVDLTPVDTEVLSLESKGRPKPGITPVKAVRFSDASNDIGAWEKKLTNSPIKPAAVGYLGATVAPKPLKPPPPQTPAAFRMLRQKFRNSPTPKKTRPRSPFSMQSPSRGIVKSSKKKTSILTSSPYMRSACTRRFAEALLDEEVALFTCRNLRTPVTPRRRGREMATANPLGRVLLEGDEKHFIPLSPIMRINKPAKSNVVVGSAFSAFSQGT